MKIQNYVELSNEIMTLQEISDRVSDCGYNASRTIEKLESNQEALLGKVKVIVNLTIEIE